MIKRRITVMTGGITDDRVKWQAVNTKETRRGGGGWGPHGEGASRQEGTTCLSSESTLNKPTVCTGF